MEIIIRTDQSATVSQPGAESTGAAEAPASGPQPPAAVAEQAAAIGAHNAGPAPSAPSDSGAPPEHITAELTAPADAAAGESAGAAPTLD